MAASPARCAHRLARLGLARTFQSVELFDDLTVEENLLVASRAAVAPARVATCSCPGARSDRSGRLGRRGLRLHDILAR